MIKHLAVPFLYTPFHKLQDGTATEINLLTKGNKRGKMRQIIFKKSYIVYTLLILFSSIIIPITNASSLSYQTDVGVSFTFNPTLSVSISPSDLIISNLTPGTTDTSNEISVNVSTNNVYGYNLYATVGNSTYSNTNLTHSSSNDVFANISTTADLPSLTTGNTWGYTYSLDNGTTWSNYNGLPLYTTDNPTRLKKNAGPAEDTVNFKIAAKSSSTQPSGTYTNIINFTAVTKPTPVTLADAYASEGKELYHGYYKMQDMTHTICEEVEDIGAQLQVIDIRDDKVYWIAKLKDNHCWMTQNLDLDLTSNPNAGNYIALTSENTDLTDTTSAAYQDGYTVSKDGTITWLPERDTIAYNNLNSTTWQNDDNNPYSYDSGDTYYYSSNSNDNDIKYTSLKQCEENWGQTCTHYKVDNYYNWSAAIASNSSNEFVNSINSNSICPKNWQLPRRVTSSNDFENLVDAYSIASYNSLNLRNYPTYFVRSGYINNGSLNGLGSYGRYWLNSIFQKTAYYLDFYNNYLSPSNNVSRGRGFSARCLAR